MRRSATQLPTTLGHTPLASCRRFGAFAPIGNEVTTRQAALSNVDGVSVYTKYEENKDTDAGKLVYAMWDMTSSYMNSLLYHFGYFGLFGQ